jgi:cell division control protein 45
VGGLVDLEAMLGLEVDEDGLGGMGDVEIWVIDARRPWNLSNVFGMQSLGSASQEGQIVSIVEGVSQGKISSTYRPGRGGIVVFDDGDIEDGLGAERDAYCALAEMPELGDEDLDESEDEVEESEVEDDERIPDSAQPRQKRKSPSAESDDSESDADEGTPRKRRRSNSVWAIPPTYSMVLLTP